MPPGNYSQSPAYMQHLPTAVPVTASNHFQNRIPSANAHLYQQQPYQGRDVRHDDVYEGVHVQGKKQKLVYADDDPYPYPF